MTELEERFMQEASKDFIVIRRGWPDFLLLKRDFSLGFGVELKQGKDKLSADQQRMQEALQLFGIPTYNFKDSWSNISSLLGTRTHFVSSRFTDLLVRTVSLRAELEMLLGHVQTLECQLGAAETTVPAGEGLHPASLVKLARKQSEELGKTPRGV